MVQWLGAFTVKGLIQSLGRGIKILKARWHKKGHICKASREKRVSQIGKKRKLIKGKYWPLKRTSVLFLMESFLYLASEKLSEQVVNLPAARVFCSRNLRSGIWWLHSLEKVGTSGKTECLLEQCDQSQGSV